jgi:hypothetical protein
MHFSDLRAARHQETKEKAASFLRDVVGDQERADEVEAESPQDYAERKRIVITNSSRRVDVANVTI